MEEVARALAVAAELEEAGVPVASIPVKPCWLVQWGPQPLWLQTVRGLRYAMPDPGARLLVRWLSELAPELEPPGWGQTVEAARERAPRFCVHCPSS